MGWLKGPKVGGVIQVNQPVNFTKEVQSSFFEPWGSVWYCDYTDGNDSYDGKSPSEPKKTLSAANTASSNEDVICLSTGDHTLSETLTISNYDMRIIGASRTLMQPRVDLWMAAATTFNPMVEVSGRGNTIANLTFRHGSSTGYATDLTAMTISGRYNYFENVYFYTPMYSQQDVATTYLGIQITGHNNYFKSCKFGSEGLARDKANYNLKINGIGNVFEDCVFTMMADGVSPSFINLETTDDRRYNFFKNCLFYVHWMNNADQINYAVRHNGTHFTANLIFDSRCMFVGVDYISDTEDDQHIWIATPGDTAASAATLLAVKDLGT